METFAGILKGFFKGSDELLGSIIGLGITAFLMLLCVLPIYFILKKITGSKSTFREDLAEYLAPAPKPTAEALRVVATLDSVESITLQVYKYLLLIALIAGTLFIGWFFINVQQEAERDFLRVYFGAAYLFLVVWVVGSFVVIRRRQARQTPRGTEAPAAAPAGPLANTKEPSSINTANNDSSLTPQQIVIVIMVFVLATGTFAAALLMLRGLPGLSF